MSSSVTRLKKPLLGFSTEIRLFFLSFPFCALWKTTTEFSLHAGMMAVDSSCTHLQSLGSRYINDMEFFHRKICLFISIYLLIELFMLACTHECSFHTLNSNWMSLLISLFKLLQLLQLLLWQFLFVGSPFLLFFLFFLFFFDISSTMGLFLCVSVWCLGGSAVFPTP